MYRPTSALLAVCCAALLATACGDDDTTPTDPTPPPAEITENFAETLTVNGARTFQFTVQRAGGVVLRVVTLNPSDAVIGISIGPFSAQGACSQSVANDAARSATVLQGTATAGSFCARVFDPGVLTAPVAFEISVTHF